MKNRGVIKRGSGACVLGVLFGLACANAPPSEEIPSAESYYQRGLDTLEGQRVLLFFHDVDHSRAIELFQEVIDNYPYSSYATLAELNIADVYFDQGRYEEAAGYFQDFVELHPTHPQVPYAIYRRGLCSFEQMRAVDQDASPTQEAVAQFRVLLQRYPASEYADDALQKLGEAEDRLATHVLRVGDFYFERGEFYGALKRYREALEMYPDHGERLHTLYRLGVSLQRVGREEEAQPIFRRVLESNPEGELAEEAEEALRELNGATGG